ncbi:Family 2 glycosyl transferase [Hyella patelloides LEGE 07179]|uniref:Family 2 glycosyl transferase n=1 Tax=Hyella patelloides LEGE 07179 TaxID=945734 RepID=A0A563VZ51_9CYAN|nr:glycosyltransferase [Hyella patelloides]VEP16711.1 Family 2 glycosyl transferase [Hyella patelloides LEGE 07179]
MNSQDPNFSIIIPTYNRPERLANCLQAIAKIIYSSDRFEVIVVDDGSESLLDGVVAPLQNKIKIKLLRQENAGPAAARNRGAKEAQGEFLAFTDDDCQPLPNWLSQFAASLATAPKAMIGGKTINALSDNPFSTASQELIDYLYEYYNPAKGKKAFFASNNIAMPKSGFDSLGGFDVSFPLAAAEDRDFCDRWEASYPMVYDPEAQINHYHHLNFKSFWRQHFGYGRGAFCFHQLRAQRAAKELEVEPLSFYFDLLSYPFSQEAGQPKVLISSLFFLSQVANVSGFFWEKLNT